MIQNLKTKFITWVIDHAFGILPDEKPELWKWAFTYDLLHDNWNSPDFANEIKEPIPHVFTFPMLSEEYCDWLVQYADEQNKWSFNKKDEYAGWEVDLYKLNPAIDAYHKHKIIMDGLTHYIFHGLFQWIPECVEKCFIIKYEPDRYPSMDQHHDEYSLISMSINLNDGYEGGELSFVRNPEDPITIPKGHGVLFAGNPMMSHQAHPVTEGNRYVLVYWVR